MGAHKAPINGLWAGSGFEGRAHSWALRKSTCGSNIAYIGISNITIAVNVRCM